MSLGDLPNSRKRLTPPTGDDNLPKRRHLNHGFNDVFETPGKDQATEQPSVAGNVPLYNSQQSAVRMTQDNRWDLGGTVELNIETDWKFNFKGTYSALLSTYSSMAVMKSCLSPKHLN